MKKPMIVVLKPAGFVVALSVVVIGIAIPSFRVTQKSAIQAEKQNTAAESRWSLQTAPGAQASIAPLPLVRTQGKSGTPMSGYRVTISQAGSDSQSVALINPIQGTGIAPGQALKLHFWARADVSTEARALLYGQGHSETFSWKEVAQLEPTWREFTYTITNQQYEPGQAILALHIGSRPTTVEVAGISFEQGNR